MRRPRITTRPFQPRLAVLAVVGFTLLLLTILLDVGNVEENKRRLWLYVAVGAVVLLSLSLAREAIARTRTDRTLARATAALSELNDPRDALGVRTIPQLLDDLAARIRGVLGAGWSSVALTDDETGALCVAAISGDAPYSIGDEVRGDQIPTDTTNDRLAVPMVFGEDRLGLVEIGAPTGRFKRVDHDLLRLLTDRLAGLVEQARLTDVSRRAALGAAQARAHLALIADVSSVLARSLEDTAPAMRTVCDILIRDFADVCAIHHTMDGGRLELVAGTGRSPRTDALVGPDGPDAVDVDALRRVLATGRSELNFVTGRDHVYGREDPTAESMRAAGMTSWVVAPIRLRGLALGTLTVATGRNRRGYRPSDQAIVDEIASRLAIVIERGVLYAEARQAGVAAERRADQLANLIEAAISLTHTLRPADVLQTLVQQAARVLDASHARAWLSDDSALEATHGTRDRSAIWVNEKLVDPSGRSVGSLTVERDEARPFDSNDEALLLLVARLASAALQNARLFDGIRLREQRLGALFAASPLAILEFDLAGSVQDANPAALGMFGAPSPQDLSFPPALVDAIQTLRGRMHEGLPAEAEVSVTTDRGRLDLWVSAAPLQRESGAHAGMLVVLSDTTERRRLEEQLIDAHRFEAIAQLAGGIAHDFNNLLTIIVGYSDMLLHTHPADEEIRAIQEAGRLAAVITNQLLTLSRRQVVQPVIVELGSACTALEGMLRRLVGDRVTLVFDCPSDETAIRIDPGQLEQVLFNLVLNSRDASSNDGVITISTRQLSEEPGSPRVALVVEDDGGGMDDATRARCLEPFFTTKGRRGIGLGLATVNDIVQRAGGELRIESELGAGTTIAAIFPRVDAAAAPTTTGHRRDSAKILLVDDDDLIRRYASTVLVDAGFEVTTVSSGEAAMTAMTADGGFDLVISDIVMPGMSGFDLARRVGEQWPAVARLLITGYAGTDTTGTDLADVTVLPKPFAGDELVRAAVDALA